MGEPGGIGPEVIVKAMFCAEIRNYCSPVVIGDLEVMKEAVKLTGLPLRVRSILKVSESIPAAGDIELIHVASYPSFKKGCPSKKAGRAVVKYIRKAVGLALKKDISAIVTAPISKGSLRLAGYKWP